jgi:5-methyltetrahydrofolate--homocysteine methyltransferase
MPNAGMPVLENGVTVFRQTPDQMAARTRDLLEAGAQIVGGCCGTTPAHVSAMRAVLNADR